MGVSYERVNPILPGGVGVSYERGTPVGSESYQKGGLRFEGRPPRQSVGGGKSIQKRVRTRSPLLKTTAVRKKLTFGDPFEDSGVAGR